MWVLYGSNYVKLYSYYFSLRKKNMSRAKGTGKEGK